MLNTWVTRLKPAIFCLCLLPALLLAWGLFNDTLGAEPIDVLADETGIWALRLLLITLCITPLRKLTGWAPLVRLRRMLGVYAFFYAALHFLVYLVLDQFFYWPDIVEDIIKRKFIFAGFLALVILAPLAATSTRGMMKRLGGRRWQILHRGVYIASISAATHFVWKVKSDYTEPAIYAFILALLLGYRLWGRYRGRARQSRAAS